MNANSLNDALIFDASGAIHGGRGDIGSDGVNVVTRCDGQIDLGDQRLAEGSGHIEAIQTKRVYLGRRNEACQDERYNEWFLAQHAYL